MEAMASTKPSMSPFDLTLYLVTDENPNYLAGKDFVQTVDEAIQGGVTIVQYRQKQGTAESRKQMAARLLQVTRRHGIPLIINDDIETCLAVDAEGVHIGQDDTSLHEARTRLGDSKIIGVTVASVEEANIALEGGANYLGIGTMFPTPTKTDTKFIIGTRGTHDILSTCKTGTSHPIPCVAIGSINASNTQRVLHQSSASGNRLNGIAVVSAIMAAPNPKRSAAELRSLILSFPSKFYTSIPTSLSSTHPANPPSIRELFPKIPSIIKSHTTSSVLCHNMTNTVVQSLVANVCLATGSSPIMSLSPSEAADLALLHGALVVNIGTLSSSSMEAFKAGAHAYNAQGNPVVFDPVGGGATTLRREAIKELMASAFFDLIKGNEGEIAAVLGSSSSQQRGVDSGPSTTSASKKAAMAKTLAIRENCVVLMTGATDYLSDGSRTLAISNGSHYLGRITGAGCSLGAVVASYMALHKEDKLLAALAGILHYEIAAERAEHREDVRGPGTFQAAFIDELYALGKEVGDGPFGFDILGRARVEER